MCPARPSARPCRPIDRNAAAMCSRIHFLWSWKFEKAGRPSNEYPPKDTASPIGTAASGVGVEVVPSTERLESDRAGWISGTVVSTTVAVDADMMLAGEVALQEHELDICKHKTIPTPFANSICVRSCTSFNTELMYIGNSFLGRTSPT
jgi:hypothetical protein